jgi:hypothetical protein
MSSLMLYSPSDVLISIGGFHMISGVVADTFINITKDVSPFEVQGAMDGSIARLYKHDEGYKVEITLAQSSASNNILSGLYNIDTATRMGKFPLFITDGRGSSKFFALTAWIDRLPSVAFGSELQPRTWIFQCTDATLTVGGNADQNLLEKALDFGASVLPLFKDFGLFG